MNESMKKFRQRIVWNAILKATLCSLVIACGVLLVSALASWIFGFPAGIWLSVGLFFVAIAVSFPLFYLLKFRPTAKDVARKVDSLGLEERLITMMELEGDDSYIAQAQRADAQAALAKADHTLLKVAVSVSLIVAVSVAAILGAGALTVDSLYTAGVIPSAVALAKTDETGHSYTLKYVSKEGGKIYYWDDGDIGEEVEEKITVAEGKDAPAIIAVPAEGYVFTGWSDGKYDPFRQDLSVSNSISVNASFETVYGPSELEDDGDGNGDGGENGDAPPEDAPPQQGNDGNGGDNLDPNESNSASGTHSNSNSQVNNGETYYGDEYGNAYDQTQDRLGSDSDLPGNLQDGINDYMGSIGRGDGSGSGEGSGGSGEGSGSGGD